MTVNVCSASNFQIPTSEGGIFLRFINFPSDWIFRELPKWFGIIEQKPPSDSLRNLGNFEFRNFSNWCHSHRIWWECFNQLWSDHSKSGKGFNKNLRKNKKALSELKTLDWDILNPDRIINLEIKNERRTSNI